MTPAQYRTYFETLATRSKDIDHNPAAGRNRFALINLGDTLAKVRGTLDVTNYCLILEKFDARQTRRSPSAPPVMGYDCSFKILTTYPLEDFEAELSRQSTSFEIAQEFVKEIRRDALADAITPGLNFREDLVDYLMITTATDFLTGTAVYLRFEETAQTYKRSSCATDPNRTAHWN